MILLNIFFTQLVLIAGLSVLAISCGGSKGGSKSAAANPYSSNLSNVNLSATSAQALAEGNAWYLNSVEGTSAQGNGGDVTRKKYVSSAASSNCKPILGGLAQWCSSSSSTSQNNGTEVSTTTIIFANTAGQIISAKGNAELNNVFSGSIGTLIEGRVLSANVITLTFLRTADNAVVTYTIDKSYHSLLNPVIVTEETQTSRSDIVATYVRRF